MRRLSLALSLTTMVTLAGCKKNQPPELLPIDPQTAYVGSRFELRLTGADPDGDALSYSYSSPTLEIQSRAKISLIGSEALFKWTPIAADVGAHQVDFTVSDGSDTDTQPVSITIKSSTGPETAPVFRKPLNEGTTLDLTVDQCITVEVLVEDSDSTRVDITQVNDIPGSTMKSTGNYSATFNWCPSSEQSQVQRHVLRFVADDHDRPPTCPTVCKDFIILIISELPINCPGKAPEITHTPYTESQTTSSPIEITAKVTDDKGLKSAPTVYFTTTKPSDPKKLDYASLGQVSMTETTPDSGNYQAGIPNPTAGMPVGTTKTLYYVIVAEDNDDATGNCDHRTQLPADDTFKVTVNKPPGVPCTTTSQCKPDQVCNGTDCINDKCTPVDANGDKLFHEQSNCPLSTQFCPTRGPAVNPSHCAETCTKDSDCTLSGYKCKIFDTKKGCAREGNKTIGASCAVFVECAGAAMCLEWSGGYCAISDCDSTGASGPNCPTGSACIGVSDNRFTSKIHFLCLKTCIGSGDCRTVENYSCKDMVDDLNKSKKVCMFN